MSADMDVLLHMADGFLYGDLEYAVRIEERLSAAGLQVVRRDLTAMTPAVPEPALAHVFTGGETPVSSGSAWMRSASTARASLSPGPSAAATR